MFEGSMIPIITPFKKNGKFDEKALARLINWHVQQGCDAIVPCGTTGESATLNFEEHTQVIAATVKAVKGRVPVIAGTGANSTEEAIHLTRDALNVGAQGALLVSPYYNKPTQEGLYRHYLAIAEAVPKMPLILYNVPGRTAQNMAPATIARLSRIKNIVGIKEATGDMKQATEIIRLTSRNFAVYSGDDFTTYTMYALGCKGSISVTANIMPAEVAEMWRACKGGDLKRARAIHFKLDVLNRAMFYETNPIPVKTALAMMGRCEEAFRLPLCRMGAGNRKKLRAVLKDYALV